jgi:hypothetical protein
LSAIHFKIPSTFDLSPFTLLVEEDQSEAWLGSLAKREVLCKLILLEDINPVL